MTVGRSESLRKIEGPFIERNCRTVAALDTVCTQCQSIIETPQIQRVSSGGVKCPYCDAIFTPSKEQTNQE